MCVCVCVCVPLPFVDARELWFDTLLVCGLQSLLEPRDETLSFLDAHEQRLPDTCMDLTVSFECPLNVRGGAGGAAANAPKRMERDFLEALTAALARLACVDKCAGE